MANLTETEKSVRKTIMDQMLAHGTCPTRHELARRHGLSQEQMGQVFLNLEAAICIGVTDERHAGQTVFQGEKLAAPLPALGEVFYARPFACFENHYKVWVNGAQKWHAECAVEACGIAPMFPGREVVVRSHCRLTKEPVEIVGRDNRLLDFSPKTLRVHFGVSLRGLPEDALGWCDFNSLFASEEAARQWQKENPQVKGVTRGAPTTHNFIVDLVGKGRLRYDYQPTMPIARLLLQPGRYGFTRRGPLGLSVPDPFFLPTLSMVRKMKEKGYGNYIRPGLL